MERKYTFDVVSSFDGRSLVEVAEELGIHISSLKNTLNREFGPESVFFVKGIIHVNRTNLAKESQVQQQPRRLAGHNTVGTSFHPDTPQRPAGIDSTYRPGFNYGHRRMVKVFEQLEDDLEFFESNSRSGLVSTLRRRGRVGGSKI